MNSKSNEEKRSILLSTKDNKTVTWASLDSSWSKYCGGDMDFNATSHCRYCAEEPIRDGISLDNERHSQMPSFQLPFLQCPLCDKKDLYITKFNTSGEMDKYGFGYSKYEIQYFCPNCCLEYKIDGKWD